MNQNTRQRIVGTLVLVVAALVLLPVIFDGEGSYQTPVQTQIPPTPPQPQVARELPQRPVITADTDDILISPDQAGAEQDADVPEPTADDLPPTAERAAPDRIGDVPPTPVAEQDARGRAGGTPSTPVVEPDTPAAAAAEPVAPPSLDQQGLPQAWSVRLGAFASTTNATNLVARLQEAGHRAYTRQVDSSQGVLTAVFVGPLIDRPAAQQLLEQMRQDYQLSGLVVRYQIEAP